MLQVSDHWLGSESSLAYLLEAMDQYRAHPELYPCLLYTSRCV